MGALITKIRKLTGNNTQAYSKIKPAPPGAELVRASGEVANLSRSYPELSRITQDQDIYTVDGAIENHSENNSQNFINDRLDADIYPNKQTTISTVNC